MTGSPELTVGVTAVEMAVGALAGLGETGATVGVDTVPVREGDAVGGRVGGSVVVGLGEDGAVLEGTGAGVSVGNVG